MSRSLLFSRLARAMRIAAFCDREGIPSAEGLALAAEAEARRPSRRG